MRRALAFAGIGLAAAGCAANPRPAFVDASRAVTDRSGLRSEWIRGTDDASRVDASVMKLLEQELTADTAAEVALLSNRTLQATFEEIGVSRAELAQARVPGSTEIEAEGVPLADGISRFSVLQSVLDILVLPARSKLAGVQLEQVKARVGDEMLRVVAEAKIAFYSFQARQQLVERLELLREINGSAAELARRQQEAGNISDLDLENHKAAHDQSKVDAALAAAAARADRERLNRAMGVWGASTAWKAGSSLPTIPEEEASLEGLESLAIRQRLDLAAARFGVDAIGRALALKKGTRFLPVGFDVGVSGDKEGGKRVLGPEVRLQLPLLDLGRASIAQLDAHWRQARWRLEALAIDARSEVRQARDAMVAARDVARYYERVLLPGRARVLDLTLRRYNFMLKGPYDLLLARQNEVSAERAHVEAWRDYWIARTELERAIGGRLGSPDASNQTTKSNPMEGNAR
jgi:cobalt-zinc-cadmium efflux system outer membrane protein